MFRYTNTDYENESKKLPVQVSIFVYSCSKI